MKVSKEVNALSVDLSGRYEVQAEQKQASELCEPRSRAVNQISLERDGTDRQCDAPVSGNKEEDLEFDRPLSRGLVLQLPSGNNLTIRARSRGF
jgi:hypothetical protein